MAAVKFEKVEVGVDMPENKEYSKNDFKKCKAKNDIICRIDADGKVEEFLSVAAKSIIEQYSSIVACLTSLCSKIRING
jgi:hypothetical protein